MLTLTRTLTRGLILDNAGKATYETANYRVPTVRESQGILSESGKVRENREGQGKVREF